MRLPDLRSELRHAARSLRATPSFTVAAALALALGIGSTTAILSVVNGVLLRPLPYADADRLVVVLHHERGPVSPQNYTAWRARMRSFTDLAAAEYWTPDLTGGDNPEQIYGLRVTTNLIPLLGVRPLIGRSFATGEDESGNDHVLVISHGLWQRRFAGDPAAVGKTIALNGEAYTIIGVMPKSFRFAPFWATKAELWAPKRVPPTGSASSLRIFGRLKPGVTFDQARADVAAVTAQPEQENPGSNRDMVVAPLKERVVGNIRTPLLVLFVAVGCVLAIACANVAHMLLARATARQRELVVRTALGATKLRLVRQLFLESVMLSAIGGAGGLALAAWGVQALSRSSTSIVPRVADISLDGRVLAMAAVITLVTAIAFGLLPALRAANVNLVETLRDGDRASSGGRGRAMMRDVLVASEFVLALVLLTGAGLMVRTFAALEHVDPGFDPRGVVTMSVSTSGTPATDTGRHAAFYEAALARVRAMPGVESASWINHLPIAGDIWGFPFRVEGRPEPKPGEVPSAAYRVVFPDYFATMRLPLLAGRDVRETDVADAPPVVVVNQYLAQKYWPSESAIGKRIAINSGAWATVVGVSKNAVRSDWSAPPDEEFYVPFQQSQFRTRGSMTLVARIACRDGNCDPARLAVPIRDAVRSVEHVAPISSMQTMESVVADATADQRFYVALLAAFATVAITLAAVGIYGVMSYSVARRTHEIGIRMALGAAPGAVRAAIVWHGLAVAGTGGAVGLVLAAALTRLMRGLLFGVSPTDAPTFAVVVIVLTAVAVAACLIPARRATRIDPLCALRAD